MTREPKLTTVRIGSNLPQRLHSSIAGPGGLIVALALLVAVAGGSFLTWQQYVVNADRTRHVNETLTATGEAVRDILLAETNQRGYLLTSDQSYLEAYNDAESKARIAVAALGRVAPGVADHNLLARLRSLMLAELDELATSIRVARSGHVRKPAEPVKAGPGFRAMNQIQDLSSQYGRDLQISLRNFREESRHYARLSQWSSVLGCAGVFIIVHLSNRRITKLISTTTQLNSRLTRVNAELERFVYSASHDLQEPLRTLSLFSELARRRVSQGLEFDKELQHVHSAARSMVQLVQDLQAYTHVNGPDASESEQADLQRVIKDVLELLGRSIQEADAQVSYEQLPCLPMSSVHARILLQNLIGNALKYRDPAKRPLIHVAVRRQNGKCLLSVSDNGIGIPTQYQTQIFEPFKRLHARGEAAGTGMGLAICSRIVELCRGRIWVESDGQTGSTFRVEIPNDRPG